MKKNHGRTILEQFRQDLSRCVRCGTCSTVCPSFLADRRESRSPRGRMALIEAVLEGKLPVSTIYRDRLATCTGCLACEAACPSGVRLTTIVQAAKEAAVQEGGSDLVAGAIGAALRHPRVMKGLAWLAPTALHFSGADLRGGGGAGWGQGSGRQERGAGRKRIAFFPGCAVSYFQRDIGDAVAAVLRLLGYEVVLPRSPLCCGRPYLSLGDADAARELARKNTAALRGLNADAVVTACASCGLTFQREYPTLLAPSGERPVPVTDIHAFLAAEAGRLPAGALPVRATWHDPCHLGRGQGLGRTARELLGSVAGLELVEMGNAGRCCGFGGVMRATHPGLSRTIGAMKARDCVETGASLVVTGCPGCRMQISDALRRTGSPIAVVHTVQVIAEALGESGRRGRQARRREAAGAGQGPRKK